MAKSKSNYFLLGLKDLSGKITQVILGLGALSLGTVATVAIGSGVLRLLKFLSGTPEAIGDYIWAGVTGGAVLAASYLLWAKIAAHGIALAQKEDGTPDFIADNATALLGSLTGLDVNTIIERAWANATPLGLNATRSGIQCLINKEAFAVAHPQATYADLANWIATVKAWVATLDKSINYDAVAVANALEQTQFNQAYANIKAYVVTPKIRSK